MIGVIHQGFGELSSIADTNLKHSFSIPAGQITSGKIYAATGPAGSANTKTVFRASIEIVAVANGYLVHIGSNNGYAHTTYIAADLKEAQDRVSACIAAQKLEAT